MAAKAQIQKRGAGGPIKKAAVITLVVLLLLTLLVFILRELGDQLYTFRPLPLCLEEGREVLPSDPGFHECAKSQAGLFFNRDYLESKDLAKAFLTLISAILVASITFSEKIVDVQNARRLPLSLMVVCWFLLLSSLITCGTGLAFMTFGAGIATYQPELNYFLREKIAVLFFLLAGGAFVLALASLVFAGIASLVQKRAGARATTSDFQP